MDVGIEIGYGAQNQIEIHEWKRRCWSRGGNGHKTLKQEGGCEVWWKRTKELRVMGRSKIKKSEFDLKYN